MPAAISDRKLAANRLNAQKSTGPRTPAGKRTAAQNATRHGGFARDTLLPHEDAGAFYHFRRAWVQTLAPQTCPELFLADRAVSLAWRLKRLNDADAACHLDADARIRRECTDAFDHYRPGGNLHHLLTPDVQETIDAPVPPIAPGIVLAQAFQSADTDNPFDRLSRTEDRLQGMLHRTLRQLHQLQRQRADHPAPPECPFLPEEEPTPDLFEADDADDGERDDARREGEAPPEPRVPPSPDAPGAPTHADARQSAPPPKPKLRNEPTAPLDPYHVDVGAHRANPIT